MKRAMIPTLIGFSATIVAVVLAFALARFFDAVGLFAALAALLAPIIGTLVPDGFAYWIVPEGGAPGGILFVFLCTLSFWTLVFNAAHISWTSWRRRHRR